MPATPPADARRGTFRERLVGFLLTTFFLLPLALLGLVVLAWVLFFGSTARGRHGVREIGRAHV